MTILSWLIDSRHRRRATATIALLAALTTACRSRSDDFQRIVPRKDRSAAVRVLQNQRDNKKVAKALDSLYEKFQNLRQWEARISVAQQSDTLEIDLFLSEIIEFFITVLGGKNYELYYQDEIAVLTAEGFDELASEQEEHFLEYFLYLDNRLENMLMKILKVFSWKHEMSVIHFSHVQKTISLGPYFELQRSSFGLFGRILTLAERCNFKLLKTRIPPVLERARRAFETSQKNSR